MIRGVLLDLSGVLYTGSEVLPGAHESLQRLHKAGLPVHYITNTTRKTSQSILKQLQTMQFKIEPEELFTAPVAARDYLQSQDMHPFLLIHPGLVEEFGMMDQGNAVDAVLVGDAADGFSYHTMNSAFRYLLDGAKLITMGINRYFRGADGFYLDAGPFVRALEYASGQEAMVLGKPAREFYLGAVSSISCNADETVMVGDDLESDVLGAVDAGLQAILVRTGKYRAGDEHRIMNQASCVDDISAAVDFILEHQ